MAEKFEPLAEVDEVIAVRGDDELRYSRVDEEGIHWGYVYSKEYDKKHEEKPLEVILVHGYWESPEGKEGFLSSSEADEEELARIGLAVTTALVSDEEIVAVEYRILGTDELYYRVDGDWSFNPDKGANLEELDEYIIEPEMVDPFLVEYDKKNPELFGKMAEYEASASFIKKAFPKSQRV